MSNLKGLKVSMDTEQDSKKGIGAKSLQDLQQKIVQKFKLSSKTKVHLFLADGTEVDDEDYFQNLPQQTHLIASLKSALLINPEDGDISNDPLEQFFQMLRWHGGAREAVDKVKELLLQDGGSGGDNFGTLMENWKKMSKYVEEQKKNMTNCSTPEEDPVWFQSISTNAKSKEEYLFKTCQARVRGYLAKAEIQLKTSPQMTKLSDSEKCPKNAETMLEELLKEFRAKLKENRFYGYYFDRKSNLPDRICDESGQFLCEGRFDKDLCFYNSKDRCEKSEEFIKFVHAINPYESPESRIMFSTWNLDHVIERSRSVVPSLIEAIVTCRGRPLNVDYFHQLLFTRKNLKLVHIVCHDKQEHSGKKCDPKMFYKISAKNVTLGPPVKNCSRTKRLTNNTKRPTKMTAKPTQRKVTKNVVANQSEVLNLTRKRKICAMA